jgi:hypothetical protein
MVTGRWVPTQPGQRPVTIWVYIPEAANIVWSSWWWAECRSKHVEPSINFGIINSITRCNLLVVSTDSQFIYIWKLLYMFLVVPSPIIRSANNCIYSIWYLLRYCYVSNSSKIAVDSTNGVTNTRCCKYICLRSWWWVMVPLMQRTILCTL